MTLKELRISKNLNQKECAQYLGISLRTYQNYENKKETEKTIKYNALYKKLEALNFSNNISMSGIVCDVEYYTNVVVNERLVALYNSVSKLKKRDCFKRLKNFTESNNNGKICILYGLRRTGKTTLLFQMIGELPIEKTAYIKVQTTDTMSNLTKDLNRLYKLGYKYIFIDEITLLEDFINNASVLSDIFSMMGMKIVVSGTDSLGFAMANRDELYDRNIMIHTSFISFKEYFRLLNVKSIDKFIEYGGTLKMENMTFDDPEYEYEEVSFRDDESTRKYIDTSISRNIQHTLKNDNNGKYFNQLRELYDNGELTNVINRIVERMNHDFLLSVVEEKFKSHDLGSTKNLLIKNPNNPSAYHLDYVDYETILKRLKKVLEIKDKEELYIKLTQEHIDKIKKYLELLDLVVKCNLVFESGSRKDYYLFSQPGMRYSITKALVYSLLQDEYFVSISEKEKTYIIEKILEDVKGKMLEDIVLLEVKKSITKDKDVFQFRFDIGGEFDMVIYNKNDHTCSIYEIKDSNKILSRQTIHLRNENKCEIIERKYGKIIEKVVLYRGDNKEVDNIKYQNVEEFILKL